MEPKKEKHEVLELLEPDDLALLLRTEPASIPGIIMRLNHAPRYRNSLNAVVITALILRERPMSEGTAK
ncbi:MAG: hypothetical protein JNM62_10320 [Flavobacteriales bacterium]|nr:hypothetical protein [Flavobacteriales bacterium]